jgi:hypothetical protein
METNQFSTLLLMIKSITSITASHPVQLLKTSPNSVNQASQVCVEGTVAIPEPKQSLIPECFDTSGYVRSHFVLDSPINAFIGFISGDMADQGSSSIASCCR